MRSKDYGNNKRTNLDQDMQIITYFKKYGIRDYRGGGRSVCKRNSMLELRQVQ